jgi:cobalt/nickel transport system permease protein
MTLPLEHLSNRDSAFARFDPRWKLVSVLIAVVGVSLLSSPVLLLTAFLTALLLVVFAGVPVRWYLARISVFALALLPFLVLLPFTIDSSQGLFHFSWLGVWVAAKLALKTFTMLTLMMILLGTTPFHFLLQAGQQLRVPGIFTHVTLLTYRYIFLLWEELHRLRIALRVRGFRNRASWHSYRTVGKITGTLLVRGAERAERVAQAMRCRGFDGTFRSLVSFRTTFLDIVLFVLVVGFVAGLLLGEYLG